MESWFHWGLGNGMKQKGDVNDAIQAFRAAIRLVPRGVVHVRLGQALESAHDYEAALDSYRVAIRLEPALLEAHLALSLALHKIDRLPEAIAAYESADVVNNHDVAWVGLREAMLAELFLRQGEPERAVEVLEGIAGSPQVGRESLAVLTRALADLGRWDEAVKCLERAITDSAVNPDDIGDGAQFLDSAPPASYARSLEGIRLALAVEPRLPAILRGDTQPADANEQLAFARVCSVRGHGKDAIRLFQAAFVEDPATADDLEGGHRFRAACAAALAGEVQQAVAWLKADLALRAKQLDVAGSVRTALLELVGWRHHRQLAPIRDADALEKLPEADREACRAFWGEVEEVLRKAWGK